MIPCTIINQRKSLPGTLVNLCREGALVAHVPSVLDSEVEIAFGDVRLRGAVVHRDWKGPNGLTGFGMRVDKVLSGRELFFELIQD